MPTVKPLHPFFGAFLKLCIMTNRDRFYRKTEKPEHVESYRLLWESFGKHNLPPICVAHYSSEPTLYLNSAEALEDVYLNQAKFVDKSNLIPSIGAPLVGNATVGMKSNNLYHKKRKLVSSAFYKDRLHEMCDILKRIVQNKLEEWEERYVVKDLPFDVN